MQGLGDAGSFEFNGEIYYDYESGSSKRLNHSYGYANQNPLIWTDPLGLNVSYWGGLPNHEGLTTLPNGNTRPGFEPQDYRCSSGACPLNIFPDIKQRCIQHDKCYEKYKCNSSSWWSTSGGSSKPCNQCNKDFF